MKGSKNRGYSSLGCYLHRGHNTTICALLEDESRKQFFPDIRYLWSDNGRSTTKISWCFSNDLDSGINLRHQLPPPGRNKVTWFLVPWFIFAQCTATDQILISAASFLDMVRCMETWSKVQFFQEKVEGDKLSAWQYQTRARINVQCYVNVGCEAVPVGSFYCGAHLAHGPWINEYTSRSKYFLDKCISILWDS